MRASWVSGYERVLEDESGEWKKKSQTLCQGCREALYTKAAHSKNFALILVGIVRVKAKPYCGIHPEM